eukprot:scaffold2385_cov81-Skeletonema_marinoi.AAC.3
MAANIMPVDASAHHAIAPLLGLNDAIVSIAAFLSAKGCLSLPCTCRSLARVISKNEEALFEHHLRRDFPEGEVLSYVAEQRNLSRKKLYRAFLGRWSLPKQAEEKIRAESAYYEGDRNTRILIEWIQPAIISEENYEGAKLLIPNDDVDNVVFIARVGGADSKCGSQCALMGWNPEYDPERFDIFSHDDPKKEQQLIIDKSWCDGKMASISLSQNEEINEDWCCGEIDVEQLREALQTMHTLSLHAIDCQKYQVASLLDDSSMEDMGYNSDEANRTSQLELYYGFGLPTLWGVLPTFSPRYLSRNKLSDRDFRNFGARNREWDSNGDRAILEYMPVGGMLQLDSLDSWDNIDDSGEYSIDLYHPQKGVNFSFRGSERDSFRGSYVESSVRRSHQICSFLRALMEQKCLPIEHGVPEGTDIVVQMPEWVQSKKVLSTVMSFASFEDQAGKLRLVCRQFDAAVLRKLQDKLDETKVIGFSRECGGGDSWFKATVRRGWTDICLTSKESAIEDALWLASCRCRFEYCSDKESCKSAGENLECEGYSSKSKKKETHTIDKAWAQQRLSEKGKVYLTDVDPDDFSWKSPYYSRSNGVECSFQEYEMNHFELCRMVEQGFGSNMAERYDGSLVSLHSLLKKVYGVSKSITSRQFVRSIFLVIARAELKLLANESESAEKKARSTPSAKVTVGKAKSSMAVENGHYSRSKQIYRFFSADNTPMEICAESRFSYTY